MNIRFYSLFMFIFVLNASFVHAEEFELFNKLPVSLEFALGSGSNPLAGTYQAGKLELIEVQPGKKYAATVNNQELPQILIREKNKPDSAYLYEFQAKPGKKVFVRFIASENGPVIEPQTFVYNSLTKDDIKLLKTVIASPQNQIFPDAQGYVNLRSRGLTNLDGLALIKNKKAVKGLFLSQNKLTQLPENVFQDFVNLEALELKRNQLTTLPVKTFQGLSKVIELDLSENQITTLPEGIFQGLTSLQVINLGYNKLTTLPEKIFQGLMNMQKISLARNELTTLPGGIFQGLPNLKRVMLTGTKLSRNMTREQLQQKYLPNSKGMIDIDFV